jgi:precorrin-6Y C5,15-methyltransferase (decarboxylating)
VLSELPAPTHAFLGGSGGAMREILSALLAKNPEIRVVINAVTLETLAAATEAIRDLAFSDPEIISVNVARSRKTGPYHLMYAQNPVYIISAGGKPDRQA